MNQLQRAVDVSAGFAVESNDVGTGFGKGWNQAVDGFNHQVHINNRFGVRSDRFAHERTNGEVRDVVIVHYVKVNPIGPGRNHISDFFGKTSEIGRENGGSNDGLLHGEPL